MVPSSIPAAEGNGNRPASSAGPDDINILGTPLPALRVDLSEDDLRESAYEILVAASGSMALSARSVSVRTKGGEKSLTSAAASHLKKALGLRSSGGSSSSSRGRKPRSTAEIIRDQMLISDQSDMRTRRALSRAVAGQATKCMEQMLVALELLQNIPASAFKDLNEHQHWLKRQLRLLEAGLLAHPLVRGDSGGVDALRLRQKLKEMYDKSSDTGKNTESMQALRSAAMGQATRPSNSEAGDVLHWIDGYPLNVHLYLAIIGALFDTLDECSVIDEIDEVMELIKKTWVMLGINQFTHTLCFMWILFRQFVLTGQKETDLLRAAESQMTDIQKDAKREVQPANLQLMTAILGAMQSWAEKRLLAYHDSFPEGANGAMEGLLSVSLLATEVLQQDISQDYRHRRKPEVNLASGRIEVYVHSSITTVFAQMMESVDTQRKAVQREGEPIPALAMLANDSSTLATKEVEKFSPVLKKWHPCAGGIAAVTLHACYRREIKQYLSRLNGLTPDAKQVLEAADELEKFLVQIAVEEGADAEDGGKALIREMPPFEVDKIVGDLAKKWVEERLEKLGDWVDRNIEQERWEPDALREHYAPSAVEVLRIADETLDAFFALPVSQFPEVLQDLVTGLDEALQSYASQIIAPCGTKNVLVPPIPPLTRCKTKKSWFGKGKKDGEAKDGPRPRSHNRKAPLTNLEAFTVPHMCVRINTLQHIITEIEFTEKKAHFGWQKDPTIRSKTSKTKVTPHHSYDSVSAVDANFYRTRETAKAGIEQLMDVAAYRVVFGDLRDVLWDGLYIRGVTNARIGPVLEKLDAQLGVIADSAAKGLRNRVVGALMQACFDGYLLVLLAGGTSRMFTLSDAHMLSEDLECMKDLFKADGDGLPGDMVDRAVATLTQVLSLFSLTTNELIQRFSAVNGSAKTGVKPSLPPTTANWSVSDANTLLQVLCYRCDDTASKFLKKNYHLPKCE